MGMCLVLHSVSDDNIIKILDRPELIWRLIAPDDHEVYKEAVKGMNKVGFLSKLIGKKKPAKIIVPNLHFIEGENANSDLDKSWQGIHYCLNKTACEADEPMDFITLGGAVVGNIDLGYGPARLFNSEIVKELHARLSNVSVADVAANYNPAEMDKLDIYPNIWTREGDEGQDYIAEYYEILKGFIAACSKNNLGMAVYLG